LNLGLRVLGRRPDGYHELETLFCQLELADLLIVRPAKGVPTLELRGVELDCPPYENLVLKAVREFGDATGNDIGGEWKLDKRIPVEAGLGGGSSDAAGALRILQRWFNYPLSQERLGHLALKIGSDVPYFLFGGLARGRGRGEVLEQIDWPGEMKVVLVSQSEGLSTRRIYSGLRSELTEASFAVSVEDRLAFPQFRNGETVFFPNDLEAAVFSERPHVRELYGVLRKLEFSGIGVSGSGPTLFGLSHSLDVAKQAESKLEAAGEEVILTMFRNEVPSVSVTCS